MKTILSWYAKNTFVRHFLIAAGAIAITLWLEPVTAWITTWLGSNTSAIALVTGTSAWLLRFAQTQLELLVVRLKTQ